MGGACFVDSSALVKRYVAESGTTWVRAELDPTAGSTVFIARVTAVEVIAAITRRERGASLASADANTARARLRAHLDGQYQIVEVDEPVIERGMLLAEQHGLRGYDAVQLAAALQVNASYVAAGQPPIILISADTDLNAVATAEGLVVEDPNTQT